jgi:hypothetical protein
VTFRRLVFLIFGVKAADTTPPTTSITGPTNGATVSGAAVTVSANASDNVEVTKVEFYLDGTTLLQTDTTSPYSITWNTTTVTNGAHNLTSKAFDAANNSTTSTAVNVTVNNVAAGDLIATFNATYRYVGISGTVDPLRAARPAVITIGMISYLECNKTISQGRILAPPQRFLNA